MAGDAECEGEAAGDLGFDVRAQVVTVVVEVLDVARLVHVAQRGEVVDAVAAARRGDAVLLGRAGPENFVDPVGVAPAVRSFAHHLHVPGREDRLLAVQLERLVVPVGVAGAVEKFGIGGVERGSVGPLVGKIHRPLPALFRRDDHHAARGFETIDRHGGAVLEQRYRLHVVGVDVVDRTLHAVHDVENARLGAADGHAGLVRSGLSGVLHGDQTRQAAGQSLRDVGHRHLLELLAVDLRHGGRHVGAPLRSVADDDDLVQPGGVLFQNDVKRGDSPPHRNLLRDHSDVGEFQRAVFRNGDRIPALRVGRRPLGRVGDHHGHTDERVALFVRNRTSDGGLGESRPGSRQQQEQRP